MPDKQLTLKFKQQAENVAATVVIKKNMQEAMNYVVEECEKKQKAQILATKSEQQAKDLCALKTMDKIIAAPVLNKKDLDLLINIAKKKNISVIADDLRLHMSGLDIAVTIADKAIAETGTIVQASSNENLRIATMLCEMHIVIIQESEIVNNLEDIEPYLETMTSNNANYTAFITGASRTADIERILAIGVHGPLKLHIVILEEK